MTLPPELESALWGLVMALITAATGCVVALGYVWVQRIRKRGERNDELDQKRAELAQLDLDEKIRARQKALAFDAVAIAQETSYGRKEPLSGPEKANLAADKLRELDPSLTQADRSTVSDLVKIGAAQLRTQSPAPAAAVLPAGAYLVTPSQAPPPDVVRQGAPEDRPTLPPLKKPGLPAPGKKETR